MMVTELVPSGSGGVVPADHSQGNAGIVQAEDRTVAAAVATAVTEAQGLMMLARQCPRNEDMAFQTLMQSCKRPRFAEGALYRFPRGKSEISGPSVKLAREAARIWGNITFGFEIVADDDDRRRIRAAAIDLQTGTRTTAEDTFKKLIQRKINNETRWVPPDERDLRELTNRRAAILVRNCIFQLLPSDLIDDAIDRVQQTQVSRVKKDPEGERKKILLAFGDLGVQATELQEFVGKSIEQFSEKEIVNLRSVYQSIKDGHSTWRDYHAKDAKTSPPYKTIADLTGAGKLKPASGIQPPSPKQSKSGNGEAATEEQLDKILLLRTTLHMSPADVDRLSVQITKSKLTGLTKSQADVLIDELVSIRKSS